MLVGLVFSFLNNIRAVIVLCSIYFLFPYWHLVSFHFNISIQYLFFHLGDPLYVGMDITIASFDAISEVNMASI